MLQNIDTTKLKSNLDYLSNRIREKLYSNPIVLERLRALVNSPYYQFLPDSDKRDINIIRTLAPDLFEEQKLPEPTLTPLEREQKTYETQLTKAQLMGMPVEDILKKTASKRLSVVKTVFDALGSLNRASAVTFTGLGDIFQDIGKKATAGILSKFIPEAKTTPDILTPKIQQQPQWFERLYIKKPEEVLPEYTQAQQKLLYQQEIPTWKDIGKKVLYYAKNIPLATFNIGEFKDYYFADFVKRFYPESATRYQWAEEWYNSGSLPKVIVASMFGSPADIAGLVLDIALDPMTYITAGATGIKTALTTTSDIVTKTGETLLPKGSNIVLTKAGKEVIEGVTKNVSQRALNILRRPDYISKFIPDEKIASKVFKTISNTSDDILKKMIENSLTERVLKRVVSNLPYDEALKLVDLGGIKIFGKSVIKGSTIEKTVKPVIKRLENLKMVEALETLQWTRKGYPEGLKGLRTLTVSGGRYRFEKGTELLQDIFKDVSDSELDKITKYLWIGQDLVRYQNKGKKAPIELIKEFIELHDSLTPKELKVIERYENEFIKDFLAKTEKAFGIEYPELHIYYPTRYLYEQLRAGGRRVIGVDIPAFTKQKILTYKQAQALIKAGEIKPKSIIEASIQRLLESTQATSRAQLLNEVKQFARLTPQEGFVNAGKKISELKGFYLPKEYIEPLERLYKVFIADDSYKYIMQIIDKGLNIWRKMALFTPRYHFRNFISDIFSLFMEYGMEALNPRYWIDALRIQFRSPKMIKTLGMSGEEAFEYLGKIGVTQSGWYATEAGIRGVARGWQQYTPFELSRKFGTGRENLGRIVIALLEAEKGAKPEQLAEQVGKVLFHYWDITQFEREIGRRFLHPFWIWYKKNLLRQIELIFTRPNRYALIPKIARFIENVSEKPEDYEKIKPGFYNEIYAIYTPLKTKEGKPLVYTSGLPFEDIEMLRPSQMLTSVSPILRIPFEVRGGKEWFSGREIKNENWQKASPVFQWLKILPNNILNFFGFDKSNGEVYQSDKGRYIAQQIPIVYNIQRSIPGEESPQDFYYRLSLLTGFKFYVFDEEKQKINYYKKLSNALQNEIIKLKQEGKEIPNVDEIQEALRDIYEKTTAEQYNLSDIETLETAMYLAGVPYETRMLLSMILRAPYKEQMEKIKGADITSLSEALKTIGVNVKYEDIISQIYNELADKIEKIGSIIQSQGGEATIEEIKNYLSVTEQERLDRIIQRLEQMKIEPNLQNVLSYLKSKKI